MNSQNIKSGALALLLIGLLATTVWYFQGSSSESSPEISANTVSVNEVESVASIPSDGTDGIDWEELPKTTIMLDDDTPTITEAGTYIVSGSTAETLTINSDGDVRLALNGANIVSDTSAAIAIENADNAVIHLVDGSENYLEDASTRANQELDGALFSADDLMFTGNGSLSVVSNFEDGIVSNDDLVIYSGSIAVGSVDEGIRGRDSVEIFGGTVVVDAQDDGIRASNDTDEGEGYLTINGGDITVAAGDDGIKAVSSIIVNGGTVSVTESLEGMEATNITINDGLITVVATDDGINAVSDGLGGDVYIEIAGGVVDVAAEGQDSDGLDANGALVISGGETSITVLAEAPASPTDYDTTATFTGGTLTIDGVTVDEIPVPSGRPGGGAGGAPAGGGFGPPIR